MTKSGGLILLLPTWLNDAIQDQAEEKGIPVEEYVTDALKVAVSVYAGAKYAAQPKPPPRKRRVKKTPIPETGPWPSVEALTNLYNEKTPDECPAVTRPSEARTKKAREYLRQFPDQDFWEQTFKEVWKSPFLRGHRNGNGHGSFIASFDWLLTRGKDGTENVLKTSEGQYQDG